MAGSEGLRRRKADVDELTTGTGSDSARSVENGGCCRVFCRAGLFVTAIIGVFLLYAYITSPTSSVVINGLHDISQLSWTNSDNADLQHGKRLLQELKGPESIVVDVDGCWYTGLEDGRLVKIANGGESTQSVTDITKLADYSAGKERAKRRPMGLRLRENQLFVADSYHGLISINTLDHKWEQIVSYDDVTPHLAHANDLTITEDGTTIYFTDASSRWHYHDLAYSHAEGECTGRMFRVNRQTKKVDTVRDNLCFPNGIQLSVDEKKLLVSENAKARIVVLDAQSGKTVKTILLPGGGDNIRPCKTGGFWVSIPSLHNPIVDLMNDYPFVRDILTNILGSQGLYKFVNVRQGIVVKLNEDFDPLSIYYDREGQVARAITEVQEYEKGRFLLGSFIAHGIVKMEGLEHQHK